jgi:hypothetical protein
MSTGPRKVFISYSHQQGDWVWDRLVPVLKAGGAEVLIDRERFTAGRALVGQMDATQDLADVHVLVLSPDYLASVPCVHEMERAIACDPRFENGIVAPVKRVDVALPDSIRDPNPLYADLTVDTAVPPWDLLLGACGADLGTDAPSWLEARDETRRFLLRGQSVNLVVSGNVAWRGLLADLQRGDLADLAVVNLEKPAAASRRGLVAEILRAFRVAAVVPAEPEDLAELDRFLSARPLSRLALTHFDLAGSRAAYGVDLFAALRYLAMESRKLVLLVQSRQPFATLLPAGHPLSEVSLQAVRLKARQ